MDLIFCKLKKAQKHGFNNLKALSLKAKKTWISVDKPIKYPPFSDFSEKRRGGIL